MPLTVRQAALLRILARIDQEIAKMDSLPRERNSEQALHGMVVQFANLQRGRLVIEAKVAACIAK